MKLTAWKVVLAYAAAWWSMAAAVYGVGDVTACDFSVGETVMLAGPVLPAEQVGLACLRLCHYLSLLFPSLG